MNKKITIVTAFFNIGRDKYKEKGRSIEEYLNYFAFWAKLKNDLIIYTDKSMEKEIEKIRTNYKLSNKTKIIIIENFLDIEKEILEKLLFIENSKDFLNYRFYNKLPENKGKYNYINFLKTWFIKDAVENKYANGQIAWIDFGFNHGGKLYKKSEEFDFEWEYDFKDKITFLCTEKDDQTPIFRIVQNFKVYITGGAFVVPSQYAKKLWELEKTSMTELINIGFMDDDQLIHLMASRKEPEIFNLIVSDWFAIFRDFSNQKLTFEVTENKRNLKYKILKKYRIRKRNKEYFNRLKKIFYIDELE